MDVHFVPQEIDDLLSGSLTQEDEDAVLQELEEMTKVVWHIYWLLFCRISEVLLDSDILSTHTDRNKQTNELTFTSINHLSQVFTGVIKVQKLMQAKAQ